MSRLLAMHNDFGGLHGTCISNKETILSEVDEALNTSADIEFLFAESVIKSSSGTMSKIKTFLGRFGHAAIRYKYYPDINDNKYDDIVMNIVGNAVEDTPMVNFIPTKEYLFGTDLLDKQCEQGGIYNRTFYGLRIQNVSKLQLRAMHSHFQALKHREEASISAFKLFGGRSSNFIAKYMPFESDINDGIIVSESGNCSMWISSGLVAANLISRKRIFPKAIFVELYERQMRINPNNIKIVKYEEIEHCNKYWKGYKTVKSFVNPLLPIRSFRYWNLDKIVNQFVRVPAHGKKAIVVKQKSYKSISFSFFWRNLNNMFTAGVAMYMLLLSSNQNDTWMYKTLVNNKMWISALWVLVHYWIY